MFQIDRSNGCYGLAVCKPLKPSGNGLWSSSHYKTWDISSVGWLLLVRTDEEIKAELFSQNKWNNLYLGLHSECKWAQYLRPIGSFTPLFCYFSPAQVQPWCFGQTCRRARLGVSRHLLFRCVYLSHLRCLRPTLCLYNQHFWTVSKKTNNVPNSKQPPWETPTANMQSDDSGAMRTTTLNISEENKEQACI